MGKRRWTEQELAVVRDMSLSAKQVAKKTKRTEGAVNSYRSHHGLTMRKNKSAKVNVNTAASPLQQARVAIDLMVKEHRDAINDIEATIGELVDKVNEHEMEIERLGYIKDELE